MTARNAVVPHMLAGGNTSVSTSTSGAAFVPFPSQPCRQLTVVNDTGVAVEVRQGGAGVAIPVFNGSAFPFFGLSNTSELQVRRVDTANTGVIVKARWEI